MGGEILTRLGDDIKKALAQMEGFIKNAEKRNIRPPSIIKREGTKIPNVSFFGMKPYYDEYGKNVIYSYDKTSMIIMPLGKYTHEEIVREDSINKSIKRKHINYLGIKKYDFIYLTVRNPSGIPCYV